MQRRAFTLVELLMVVAVIALLVAFFYPSMSAAGKTARTVVCQNHLRNISQAFTLRRANSSLEQTPNQRSDYPEPLAWPSVPMDILADEETYICPEDDGTEASGSGDGTDNLEKLEYVNWDGHWTLNQTEGETTTYFARRGEHPSKGPYTEFHCQDDHTDPNYAKAFRNGPPWIGWYDEDCLIRMYDSGLIDVPTTHWWGEPQYDDHKATIWVVWQPPPNQHYNLNTCPNVNEIWFEGSPAFGSNGQVHTNRGNTFQIPGWKAGGAGGGGVTSYGINSYAYRVTKGRHIVLVDYEATDTVVWLEDDVESENNLLNSGRHHGKVNYLLSDGTVHLAAPMAVSPRIEPEKWDP
jgi:prepilin-type N-terminal cleavage/methylation domain-containing protein